MKLPNCTVFVDGYSDLGPCAVEITIQLHSRIGRDRIESAQVCLDWINSNRPFVKMQTLQPIYI